MMRRFLRTAVLTSALMASANVAASALFDGEAANLWLVDTASGQVTSYSFGNWLADYTAAEPQLPLPTGFQALVNQLPNSSTPMSARQPGVSVIGLAPAQYTLGDDSGQPRLEVVPLSGDYTETIGVQLRVDPSQLDGGGLTLRWQRDGGDWRSRVLTQNDRDATASGYVEQALFLVREGEHRLNVELRDGATVLASESRIYQLTSSHPDGEQRDTDEDGLPDLVEQALGQDPLTSDLDAESHIEGWARFDLWLRCDELALDDCTEPADTDNDGWSDFDEQWRGTRHDDVQVSAFNDPPAPDSEAERQLIQSYKQTPAARRLYEVEYWLDGDPMGLTPDSLTAATLYGAEGWQREALVGPDALDNANLTPADLAPARVQSLADQAMANGQWPDMRLPGSHPVLIRARVQTPVGSETAVTEHLLPLAARPDLSPDAFDVEDYGAWTTAGDWKAHYRSWLQDGLVHKVSPAFNPDDSRALLTLEQLMMQEAQLRGISGRFSLGEPGPLAWLQDWLADLDYRAPGTHWQTIIDRLTLSLQSGEVLAGDGQLLDDWQAAVPAGSDTQNWLAQKLAFIKAGEDIGCFIPQSDWGRLNEPANADLLQQFQDDCPLHHTSTDRSDWQAQSRDRRYRLRLMLLAEGPIRLGQDATLLLANNDSDGDQVANGDEVLIRPYRFHTLPWLADTDTDGYGDGADLCPVDQYNRCTGAPEENRLYLSSDLSVSKPLDQGTVLLSLQLDRPAERPITLTYQVRAGDGDSAVNGVDFMASNGQVTLQPGQTTVLVPVTLLGGGTGSTFRLEVTDIAGAQIDGPDFTQVSLTDYVAEPPVAQTMATQLSVRETQSLTLDATLSYDPAGTTLLFDWQSDRALGQTLTFNDTSGQAELTAPNLTGNTDLEVTVTVSNEALLSDTARVSVTILAEDDPPEVSGSPTVPVSTDGETTVSLSQWDSLVSDPEGQVVSFDRVLSSPDAIDASLSATELRLTSLLQSAALQPVGKRAIVNESIVAWRDGFAFIAREADSMPAAIFGWQPGTGLVNLFEGVSGEVLGSLMVDPRLERLYFQRALGGETLIGWVDANQEVGSVPLSLPVRSSVAMRQVHSTASGLYLCGLDQGHWHFLNTATGALNNTLLPCSFSKGGVQTDQKVCLHTGDSLRCTEPGSKDDALPGVVPLNGARLRSMQVLEPLVVLMLENASSSETTLAMLEPVQGSADLIVLQQWKQAQLNYRLHIERGVLTLLAAESQWMLYRWVPGSMIELYPSEYAVAPLSWPDVPDLSVQTDAVFGLVPTSTTRWRLFHLDLETGQYQVVADPDTSETALNDYNYDLITTPRGPSLAAHYGDGQCQWQPVSTDGGPGEVYLSNTLCSDRLATGQVEVHRSNEDSLGRYVQVVPAGGGGDAGSVVLEITDPAGNPTSLLVNLTWQEGI
ncbi:MAG: hypothetical protein ACX931_07155 [Saccharospirillum sp.]